MEKPKGSLSFIIVAMFLNLLGFTIIIPVIPFLVGRYVSNSHVALYVGIITATYALCQFIAAPALGALSDKWGRRPILLISLSGSVVGYIIFGIGGSLFMLLLGRIVDGLTGGNISTMYAYIADITKPQDRGRIYGILGAAGGFGFMFGPAIGGLMAKFSLSAPLYLAAGITLINMAWGFFALPESLQKDSRSQNFKWKYLNPFGAFSHIFTTLVLRILFTASFLFFVAGTAMQATISVFLKDVLAFGPTGIGTILFVVGVMDIVTQGYLTGKLLPKYGEKKLAAIGLTINTIGFLLIAAVAFIHSVIFIYIAVIIFNLGDGLFQPAIGGMISNSVEPSAQGRIQGANQGMQSIARILGPLIGAGLYIYGASWPYIFGAILVFAGTWILVAFNTKTITKDYLTT